MLRVENLRLHYGSVEVLRGLSLFVKEGEIVALVGGNAAGKTSLLRAIAGVVRPTSGSIYFDGQEITTLATYERARRGVALCEAEKQLFPEMSVRENLEMGALRSHRTGTRELQRALPCLYEIFPALKDRLSQRAGSLSGGERKMVALARELVARPRLLLLDEPSLGLSSQMVETLAHAIAALNARGLTILFAEQNLILAQALAGRVCVLERGRLVLVDASDEDPGARVRDHDDSGA